MSFRDVDLLTALLNSWVNLVKQRPATFPYVVTTLRSWTPAALASLPASSVKSVEKAVRILLMHMLRYAILRCSNPICQCLCKSRLPTSGPYQGQINEILSQQGLRMAAEEKKRRALAADSRKRPSSTVAEPTDNKRIKLESEAPAPTNNSAAFLASFDFTSLPAPLITNLIVANLEAFTEAQLISMVNAYRQSRGPTALPPARPPTAPELLTSTISKAASAAATPSGPQQDVDDMTTPPPTVSEPVVKAEPVDPLQMDIDEDELEYEPEKLNEAVCKTDYLKNLADSPY